MKTVVGLFGSMAQAEQVKQSLLSEGYSAKVIANGGRPKARALDRRLATSSTV